MIIAVGYDIDTSSIIEYLKYILSNKENEESKEYADYDSVHHLTKNMEYIKPSIKSGVFYNPSCRGNYSIDARANEDTMKNWYSMRKGKTINAFCNTIHIRHDSIIAEIYTDRKESIYCILYGTAPTSNYKHTICNGNYGGKTFKFDKFSVNVIPYIYEQTYSSFY